MGARPSRTAVVDSTEGNSLVEELNVAPSNVEADAVEKATKQDINSYPHSTKDMLHIKARVARAFAELGPDRLSDKGLSDCSSHSNEKNLKKTKLQIPTCPKLQQAVLLCSSICHICHWFVAVLGGGLLFFFYFVFNFHWPVAAAAARVHFRLEGCTTNLTNVNVSCQYKLSVGLSRMDRFASVAPEDIVALPQYWPTIEEEDTWTKHLKCCLSNFEFRLWSRAFGRGRGTWVKTKTKERQYRKERKGKGRKEKERKGKDMEGKDRNGKGREREGKEKEGKERKGKGRKGRKGEGKERERKVFWGNAE